MLVNKLPYYIEEELDLIDKEMNGDIPRERIFPYLYARLRNGG